MYAELELNVGERKIHLVEVKYSVYTQPAYRLEASRKQHEIICKRLKGQEKSLHTILLGVGGSIYASYALNHLQELGLNTQSPK